MWIPARYFYFAKCAVSFYLENVIGLPAVSSILYDIFYKFPLNRMCFSKDYKFELYGYKSN